MNKINIENNKYSNCKIIKPKKTHLYTFILLHTMTVSIDYFDNLINNLKIDNNLSSYYDNIKFILRIFYYCIVIYIIYYIISYIYCKKK